ncbi:replication factor C, activator 1, putative [Ichthyophthirius multifiliis]|uniref:Replication factor C, activator 1, putative n=1 Tax=Ichthyophthirius multifiliis TaxID=5932 RepID=G0R3S4_ICHMU|nr:replication factor C, activator 1, putative [Ichthyophthirius multifiliis]EGR27891.1 replication factor C, activator 1, putative [Ichthyophthirius multifiliis]|eukprot:XP_004027236.1 replication factor C, activator 1, putative [Ichthyophthirius multifiliis]
MEEEHTQNNRMPWVEKYRPNKIDEVSYQEEVVKSLEGVLQTGNLPHIIFHGPPGTGKTSSILAFAKQLYGPNFYRDRILELNASDDRGIQVVREKIKKFAQQVVVKNPDKQFFFYQNQKSYQLFQIRNYKCPNYKIIILDEADSMTTEAQSALRRIIEDNSSTTRFCIICNYITKIIEPLASRCVKFRFKPIVEEAQLCKLKEICDKEYIQYEDQALEKLIHISNGDLRKSVNLIQSASTLFNKSINLQTVLEISGSIPDEHVINLYEVLLQKNLNELRKSVQQFIYQGFSADQLINQFSDIILYSNDINEIKKARIFEKIAQADQGLNERADSELQILNMFSCILSILTSQDFPRT